MQRFDLVAALEKGDITQDPELRDGDQVMIMGGQGILLMGKVKTPGVYYPPRGMTLSRLIALAGGFSLHARRSSVIVTRMDKPNEPFKVDVKAVIKEGKLDKDPKMYPGDVVFVEESCLGR